VNEQSIGWDVGVEQQWLGGRLVTDVTYFNTEFMKKIELVFSPTPGPALDFIYQNGAGIAQRQGLELSATANWTPWFSTTAAYTWLDATDSFGDPEIRRPPHAGGIDATIRWADNRARATIGMNYNGTRKDFFFQPLGSVLVNLPGAVVARAIVSYDLDKNTTIYARAENLFDSRYEEIYSYRAQPFAAFAGIRVRFGE
jgi:vitamin B12 transporter